MEFENVKNGMKLKITELRGLDNPLLVNLYDEFIVTSCLSDSQIMGHLSGRMCSSQLELVKGHDIKVTTISTQLTSDNFKLEIYNDETYINDHFIVPSDIEVIDELIEVLRETKLQIEWLEQEQLK